MFLILAAFLVTILCVDLLWRAWRDKKANIPGSIYLPVLGTAYQLLNSSPSDIKEIGLKDVAIYGKTFRYWLLYMYTTISFDVKLIEAVLGSPKNLTKHPYYNFFNKWIGTGLFTSNGAKWQARRKVLNPAFHFKMFEKFVKTFDEQSSILVENLRPFADSGCIVNLQNPIKLATLDIISESAMGVKINAQQDPSNEYVKAIEDMVEITGERITSFWFHIDIIFQIFARNKKKREEQALKILHDFTDKIIKERKSKLLVEQFTNNEVEKKNMTLLDILLVSTVDGKPLSDLDIRNEVDAFMFAGHDTVASGIGFTLYLLSRYPEVQQKAFEEIQSVIGADLNKPITYSDLQDLKYLELVIKESLRLYPPVYVIGRRIGEEIRFDDKVLRSGSYIAMPLFLLMKDPDIFLKPELFIPERHIPNNQFASKHNLGWIPFSAGQRGCIGQKFGMLEMKSIISKVLRCYELTALGPEVEPVEAIVMRSGNGYNMGLNSRVHKKLR